MTASQVKNYIRRVFREAVDRTPNREKDFSVWLHFESRCAYCEKPLDPDSKGAHIDHLVSAANGGSNQMANRVLACASCNESEKRDLDWEEFLLAKADAPDIYARKRERIIAWQAKHAHVPLPDAELLTAADRLSAEVILVFDDRLAQLRMARDDLSKPMANER